MRPEADTTAALIIPALNEEAVLGRTLDHVPPGLFRMIIVADNGSTDNTGKIAVERGATVIRETERGYGAACLKAIAALPDEITELVFLQADFSEDPEEARLLLAPIVDGRADLVLGSRTMGSAEPGALLPHQRVGNWIATALVHWLYGYRYTDMAGYRAIRRDALNRLGMRERNYGWTIEMQVRAIEEGLRIMEVPISYRVRAAGENKVSGNVQASVRAGVKIISTIFRLWRRRKKKIQG